MVTLLFGRRALGGAAAALLLLSVMLVDSGSAQSRAVAVHAPSGSAGAFLGAAEYPMSPSSVREWAAVLGRANGERGTIAACDRDPAACASPKLRAWRELMRELRGAPASVQIERVNRHVNEAIRYRPEAGDRWATPLEALARGGDCEDYAVMKYLSLIELGFRDAEMRIVVLHDDARRIGHAVLTVSVDGATLVLDSLRTSVGAASRLAGYSPRYYVNARQAALLLPTGPQRARIAAR
jgi:predicted transglutaminase-like cysteine proteinase